MEQRFLKFCAKNCIDPGEVEWKCFIAGAQLGAITAMKEVIYSFKEKDDV